MGLFVVVVVFVTVVVEAVSLLQLFGGRGMLGPSCQATLKQAS